MVHIASVVLKRNTEATLDLWWAASVPDPQYAGYSQFVLRIIDRQSDLCMSKLNCWYHITYP